MAPALPAISVAHVATASVPTAAVRAARRRTDFMLNIQGFPSFVHLNVPTLFVPRPAGPSGRHPETVGTFPRRLRGTTPGAGRWEASARSAPQRMKITASAREAAAYEE
ncbi:hypothetical protein GCM10010377_78340 [Streptomyces viridiviolaceus]|nr:hypothetical protein GCM10010377_78340 [Streptomyces viridiviolaceus]